jgi:AcrR family transcriptional regulator
VGRPPEPERRQELLEAVVEYVLKNGLTGLSLRPLAKGVGTSARMLLYHFESREKLLALIIDTIREQLRLFLTAQAATDEKLSTGLRTLWSLASRPDAEPYIRLFFELYALAVHDRERYGEFLDTVIAGWIAILQENIEEGDVATATLTIAVTRGLMLDLLATRDPERTGRALEIFVTEVVEPRERKGLRVSKRSAGAKDKLVGRLVAEADGHGPQDGSPQDGAASR